MEILRIACWRLLLVSVLLSVCVAECRQVGLQVSDSVTTYEHTIDCCTRRLQHISSTDVTLFTPPHINGEWMSSNCEVRPGPEFIIRRYKFHSDNSYMLHQFYYKDSSCTKPTHTLRVRGKISHVQDQYEITSSAPQGATRSSYEIDKIVLVAYDTDTSMKLMEGINETCPGYFRESEAMKLFKRYVLFDWTQDDVIIICTEGLAISIHELEVLKQEVHRVYNEHTKEFTLRQELFLGDISTDRRERIYYEPKAYQTPLVRYQANDTISNQIQSADDFHPPILAPEKTLPVSLEGEWVSIRCEVKGSFFMTRHISYFGNKTWNAGIKYFVDPNCRRPAYSITKRGSHSDGVQSSIVDGGTNFNLKTEQVVIKPLSLASAQKLNSDGDCGRPGSWHVDTEQDVTYTNGCKTLGLIMSTTEYQLYQMKYNTAGKLLLYDGQLPTSGQYPDQPELRPTSYSDPLIHCAGINPILEPPMSQNVIQNTPPQPENSANSHSLHRILLVASLIVLRYTLF
ncbi:protein APCDD1-like [Anneissia japonica]|uniref:protein APCDD1-like n=1 Tax=Anneissia japonica TaxID=1529436 RepID=UPI0014255A99|nr:protein APCDD1-like [Anneissia japonica]